MENNKIILIAGDSWGCGEWEKNGDKYDISHPGLAKYLLDLDYQIINLSMPGGTNRHTSRRIDDFLQSNKHLKIEKIIIFQTEWHRGIFLEDPEVLNDDLKFGYQVKDRVLHRFYSQLSKTSTIYNVPMYIVGGCSDTVWFEKNYPGLQIACQSMTNLLLENTHRILNPTHALLITDFKEIKYVKKHLNGDDLELLLADIEKGDYRKKLWQKEKRFFWPDGMHANRHGHKVLFDFLNSQGLFDK
jgi:lysophospholipase L1-like esterase